MRPSSCARGMTSSPGQGDKASAGGFAPALKRPLILALSFAPVLLGAGRAEAHASEQAFVLLLPTDVYITTGCLTVALTALLLLVPEAALMRSKIWLSHLPLSLFMILYTLLGLWLLATPKAG